MALDKAQEKPAGTIYLIPACLEMCKILDTIAHLHAVNLFEPHGYNTLVESLRERTQQLSIDRSFQEQTSVLS